MCLHLLQATVNIIQPSTTSCVFLDRDGTLREHTGEAPWPRQASAGSASSWCDLACCWLSYGALGIAQVAMTCILPKISLLIIYPWSDPGAGFLVVFICITLGLS